MAYVNEYRQFDPYAQPGFIKSAANPAEQGAYVAGAAQGARAAYEANQRRLAAEQAYNAQQQAAGPSTYANASALRAELQQNQAEIAKLQQELKEIGVKYGDQDNMDRILAANRARIGDIGNSRAHQQDIQNRMQWRWQMDKLNNANQSSQKKAEVKALVDKLDSAYEAVAWAESKAQKDVAQNRVNRLEKEYEDLTGEKFPNPFEASTGVPNAGEQAKTLDVALAKYNNSKNDKGLPTEAAKAEALKDMEGLPFSAELAAKYNEIKNAKTQESAAASAAKLAKEQKAAVNEVTADTIKTFELTDKDSYDATASNGQKYTVTKTKAYDDGTYDYIVKCGKQTKTIRR